MHFKKVFLSLLCFFYFYYNGLSQVDLDFIKHLSESKLKQEHKNYLEQTHLDSDSSFYFESKYYLQYGNDSMFFESFKKSKFLFFNDTLALNYACQHFVSQDETIRNFWFDSLIGKDSQRYICPIEKLVRATKRRNLAELQEIPPALQEDYKKFLKMNVKSPYLAGLFSAFIPGSGKLYGGNARSFATTLLSNTLFVLQSIESYNSKGIEHPLTILNLSFFSGFYTVNIYGSYHETKRKKKEYKNQFLIHVANYYSKYSRSLY